VISVNARESRSLSERFLGVSTSNLILYLHPNKYASWKIVITHLLRIIDWIRKKGVEGMI
jgi:hypothetical protein